MFAEMAFTGYTFKDREDIRPLCEEAGKGKIFAFCSNLAKQVESYVMAGYPEIYIEPETNKEHFYNSLYVIDRQGNFMMSYRKHFLYETDETWSEEGDAFKTVNLVNTEGVEFKAAVAICMDINTYKFLDHTKFELADFCQSENVDALFLSCNWIDSDPSKQGKDAITQNINYWLYRLYKLLEDPKDKTRYTRKWAFFCANRVGKEENTTFCGSSCSVRCNPLQLIGCLDKKNEGFLAAEINL